MSDIPDDITLSAALPNEDGRRFYAKLQELFLKAGQTSGLTVNITNNFQNPGTVIIQDQSAKSAGSSTHIGGPEIMKEKTQIHAVDSVVNYKSNLSNIQIALNSQPVGTNPKEDIVRNALKEFSDILTAVDAKHEEETTILTQRLDELTKLVVKPAAERKPKLLNMSSAGLLEATRAVSQITPGLVEVATRIASAIASWQT